jgi:hypothetical protein
VISSSPRLKTRVSQTLVALSLICLLPHSLGCRPPCPAAKPQERPLLIPAPTCDLPQLPSPIDIVFYTPDDRYIILPQAEWAKLGGYIYATRNWIQAAGPCLVSKDKPAQPATEGAK